MKSATRPSAKTKPGRVKKQKSDSMATKKKRKTIASSRQVKKELTSDSQSEDDVSPGIRYKDNEYHYSHTNDDEVKGETQDVADQMVVNYAGGSSEEDGEIGVEVPFRVQFDPESFEDSRDAANQLFRLVVNPVPVEQFYEYVS